MTNIDFNQSIRTSDNQSVVGANGQPMTLGRAAMALLHAYVAPTVDDARTAVDLAIQINRNDPLLSVMQPGARVLADAIKANAANLPSAALAALAFRLGIKGSP